MPTKEKPTGVYFSTADGHMIKVTDIPTISLDTDGDEYLANMLDSYEMEIQVSDEAMQILTEMSEPSEHLMEKIKQAFAEYFYEVMQDDSRKINQDIKSG